MTTIILILIITGILIFLVGKTEKSRKDTDIWPYYPKKPITEVEQIFLNRLQKALLGNLILAQVQLSRFISVKKGFNFNE